MGFLRLKRIILVISFVVVNVITNAIINILLLIHESERRIRVNHCMTFGFGTNPC
jgi:hypothetical protein